MRCGINNTFAGYLLPLGEIKQGYKEGEKGTLTLHPGKLFTYDVAAH